MSFSEFKFVGQSIRCGRLIGEAIKKAPENDLRSLERRYMLAA
jgi:hypothetical protein